MKYKIIRWARVLTQILFFILFVYLFLKTGFFGTDKASPLISLFFRADIYSITIIAIAVRTIGVFSIFYLGMLLLNLIFGRVFCGWICPMGSLLSIFSWAFKAKTRRFKKPSLKYKYIFLIIFLVSGTLSLPIGTIFDPLAILFKSFAIILHPELNILLLKVSEILPSLENYSMAEPHIFYSSVSIGLLFLTILLLNLIEERFWCRYVCPYGAFVSTLSVKNFLKLRIDENKCTKCGICDAICPASATPLTQWRAGECYQCFRCHVACPEAAIFTELSVIPRKKESSFDIKRREALLTIGATIIAIPFLKQETKILRPPGAVQNFASRCIRCGECIKGCPTGVLQPMGLSSGLENYGTPRLATELSYCEYECELCQSLCPTEAIGSFSPETKKMGVARVDRSICLPFAYGTECIVCEEHCPVPEKAIKLIETNSLTPEGEMKKLVGPVVKDDLCIGCGICQNKCPQSPKAIKVYPLENKSNE